LLVFAKLLVVRLLDLRAQSPLNFFLCDLCVLCVELFVFFGSSFAAEAAPTCCCSG